MIQTHRISYMKTIIMAFGLAVLITGVTVVMTITLERFATPILVIGCILIMLMLVITLSGFIVLRRDADIKLGRTDIFSKANSSRSELALTTGANGSAALIPRLWRTLSRHNRPIVGEIVRIKSWAEIHETLDESGYFDGLPWMPEMMKYCGRTATVYRSVDKIYDYGGTKNLRRMRDAVLLAGLRCDGSSDDGCQAECYLIWKTAWLVNTSPHKPSSTSSFHNEPRVEVEPHLQAQNDSKRHTCQFTQLINATSALKQTDPRQDFRPLLDGNVTLTAFAIALLTRLFIAIQRARGGALFPFMPEATAGKVSLSQHRMSVGDSVRVLPPESISGTLDSGGRNLGLWFDTEHFNHCGQKHRIAKQVERIIDQASGEMLQLTPPCLVLKGVQASGEFHRFRPQEEFIHWREVWLEKESQE